MPVTFLAPTGKSLLVLPFLQILWNALIPMDVVRRRDVTDLIGVLDVGLDEVGSVPACDSVVVELFRRGDGREENQKRHRVLVVHHVERIIVGPQ